MKTLFILLVLGYCTQHRQSSEGGQRTPIVTQFDVPDTIHFWLDTSCVRASMPTDKIVFIRLGDYLQTISGPVVDSIRRLSKPGSGKLTPLQ